MRVLGLQVLSATGFDGIGHLMFVESILVCEDHQWIMHTVA